MTLTKEELESCRAYDSTKRAGERHDHRQCKAVVCREHGIHSSNRTRCKARYSNVCKICLPTYCPLEGGIPNLSDIDSMYLRDETRKLLEEMDREEKERNSKIIFPKWEDDEDLDQVNDDMESEEIFDNYEYEDSDFDEDEEWDDDIL